MALTKVSTGLISADLASVDLNIDANTLYIDVTNNRVGINNTGPATALDVTGTVTADGLTVDGTGSVTQSSDAATALMTFTNANAGASARSAISFASDTGSSVVGTVSSGWTVDALSANETFLYGSNGVSLFAPASQDVRILAGGSEKLVVKSSGNVGIGTSSPAKTLDVNGEVQATIYRYPDANVGGIFDISGSNGIELYGSANAGADKLIAYTAGSPAMTIDSGGNVGIGTASPAEELHVYKAATDPRIRISHGTNTVSGFNLGYSGQDVVITNTENGVMLFGTNNTERMRIDSSGNLLVGKTAADGGVNGGEIRSNGETYLTATSAQPLALNRKTTDGAIATFAKDSATVGSIEVSGVDFIIDSAQTDSAIALQWDDAGTTRKLQGYQTAFRVNTANDAAVDLGASGSRFKDLYLSGGAKLVADSATSAEIQLKQTGTGGRDYRISSTGSGYGSAGALVFYDATASSERARFDTNGNFLIGKDSADASVGTGHMSLPDGSYYSTMAESVNTTSTLNVYSTGASAYRFYVGMGGQIYATNTSITAISDESLKENIRDLDKGLDTIKALKPRRFDWKNGDGNDIMGFVAQEVQDVLPELIHEVKYDAETSKLGLKMGDMIPSLVKAIQEQQDLIESLTARIAQLEGAN